MENLSFCEHRNEHIRLMARNKRRLQSLEKKKRFGVATKEIQNQRGH